jgi:aerobic-type carbon monoxide dehydrogenase small subunit (CoxS/CutS family)
MSAGNGNVIEFDVPTARAGLAQMAERAVDNTAHLAGLSNAISAAQQSLKSVALLQSGYCGSGLKQEIESAQALNAHISTAGKIVQAMIMEATQ